MGLRSALPRALSRAGRGGRWPGGRVSLPPAWRRECVTGKGTAVSGTGLCLRSLHHPACAHLHWSSIMHARTLRIHITCTHARTPRARKPLLIPPPPTVPRLAEFQMAARATAGSFADGIRLPIRCYLIVAPANSTHSTHNPHAHPAHLPLPIAPIRPHHTAQLPDAAHHPHALSPPRSPTSLPHAHPPNRRAVLHNLRYDDTIMQLHNASGAGTNASLYLTGSDAQAARLAAGGACTTISFRSGAACCAVRVGCAVLRDASRRSRSGSKRRDHRGAAAVILGCISCPCTAHLHTTPAHQVLQGALPMRKLATWA